MKRNRQLHLWIGLFCSVFILLQSVTGLLLLEPWIIGGGQGERGEMSFNPNGRTSTAAVGTTTTGEVAAPVFPADGVSGGRGRLEGGGAGISGFIKNLHEGRIGTADISWLLDLSAIGMIVLTITGIILSVKTLKAQHIRRRKLRTAA